MHANRNKKAVKRVEKGMMKANRIRNLFAVFAIVLTTFMITTVFSLGINYMENMKLMQVRTAGTTANASLAMPTEKQEQQIKNLEYVKTVGTQYMVGSVAEKNDEGRDLSIALSYYDTTEWDKHYKETIKDIEGKYPSNENEIMLSKDALSQLGMKEPKLNMEIPLSYYDKNGQQEKNFTLSGWFHSYTGTGMGFVSEAYCKNAGYTMAEDGVLSLSLNKMPDDFYRIQKDVELNENQSFGGAVSMKSSSGSVIAMVILLVFFIIGSGYLLIYNVLYISISNDTRFYGLMKTLGTTQKQIKSLVKNQAVKFACIGIPIGILLATAVSFGIVPFVLNEGFEQGKSMMDAEVFFHPSISKPFSIEVLRKKVLAVLKRSGVGKFRMKYRDLELDKEKCLVLMKGQEIHLTSTEYKLLLYLMENRGRVVTKAMLLEQLWDIDGNFVDDNTVRVNIKRLRQKLNDEKQEYIVTVFGMGYSFGE